MKRYVLVTLVIVGTGIVALVFITLYAFSVTPRAHSTANVAMPEQGISYATLTIGTTTIRVELAESKEELTRGLSGRTSLSEGYGMVFVMPYPAQHKFWMPDMHFAIDMVWFDEQFTVVDVTNNATPESYPTIFTPKVPALYILEVPAGYAKQIGISIGLQATLSITHK